jgi:secondary thiamine-phosphate synthase enzyme
MITQKSFKIITPGRGMINVSAEVFAIVTESKIAVGICNVFLHHTSASIIICENADISVQRDMEVFMGHLVPDGDNLFSHVAEGPDDMPAHVRTILTQSSLTIPVLNGSLNLGTWQGIYLWEHRLETHSRKLTVTVMGENGF